MANEHEPDIGQMWRRQPQAGHTLSLDEIRTKAQDFDRKVKQWRDVTGLLFALLIAKNAWEVWVDTDIVERAGDSLLLAALLYVVYRFGRRARANAAAARLGQASCLEHYRAQLVRQRELSRDGWTFVLPFAPGLILMVFARALQGRPASQMVVMIALTVALFVGVIWTISRSRRKLEREIAALESQ
jgi:hypothetical protein